MSVGGTRHTEIAEWHLDTTDDGFCIRVHDIRRVQHGGPVDASSFTPLQVEGAGWCKDPHLRTFGSERLVEAARAQGLAAGLPEEGSGAFTNAATAMLDLQQGLFGILLFDVWNKERHTLRMPGGKTLAIHCQPLQGASGDTRSVTCELDAGLLHAGLVGAMVQIAGSDSDELEQMLRDDTAPAGMARIRVEGHFSEGSGLPHSITWTPDAQDVVPTAGFTFAWTPGPAMAPELPLDPCGPGSCNPNHRPTPTAHARPATAQPAHHLIHRTPSWPANLER